MKHYKKGQITFWIAFLIALVALMIGLLAVSSGRPLGKAAAYYYGNYDSPAVDFSDFSGVIDNGVDNRYVSKNGNENGCLRWGCKNGFFEYKGKCVPKVYGGGVDELGQLEDEYENEGFGSFDNWDIPSCNECKPPFTLLSPKGRDIAFCIPPPGSRAPMRLCRPESFVDVEENNEIPCPLVSSVVRNCLRDKRTKPIILGVGKNGAKKCLLGCYRPKVESKERAERKALWNFNHGVLGLGVCRPLRDKTARCLIKESKEITYDETSCLVGCEERGLGDKQKGEGGNGGEGKDCFADVLLDDTCPEGYEIYFSYLGLEEGRFVCRLNKELREKYNKSCETFM